VTALDVRSDELRRAPVVTLRELARRRGMSGWAFADRDTLARRIAEDEQRATEAPPASGPRTKEGATTNGC